MRTFVVLPTFNEVDNLPKIVQALFSLPVPDLNVLVVDDNSPDGTGQLAEELKKTYPALDVLHRKNQRGLGGAYIAGFEEVLRRGADSVVQMDADFSHSPEYLPRFLAKLADHDVVVGSRYVPGGKLDPRWSKWRYLLSWWANSVWVRGILGLQVHDATAGFKAFRRNALESIGLERIKSNGYVFQVEVAYLCEKMGLHILEVPIFFEDRRIGKSKMSQMVKLEAALRTWQIRWRYSSMRGVRPNVEFSRETS